MLHRAVHHSLIWPGRARQGAAQLHASLTGLRPAPPGCRGNALHAPGLPCQSCRRYHVALLCHAGDVPRP